MRKERRNGGTGGQRQRRNVCLLLALLLIVNQGLLPAKGAVIATAALSGVEEGLSLPEDEQQDLTTPTPLPEDGQQGLITPTPTLVPSAPKSDMLYLNQLSAENLIARVDVTAAQGTIVSEHAILLADLTNGVVKGASNSFAQVYPSGLSELYTLLLLLRNLNPEETIVLTEEMVAAGASDSIRFAVGDTVSVYELLRCFYLTGGRTAQTALVTRLAEKESKAVTRLGKLLDILNAKNTSLKATYGTYNKEQYTSAYDMYLLLHELLKYDLFSNMLGNTSVKLNYTGADGTAQSVRCTDTAYRKHGEVILPAGYTLLGQIQDGDAKAGYSQIVLALGADGHYYLSILLGLPYEAELSTESGRIFATLSGTTYYDIKYGLVLPTESNDARYQYLFGTDTTFFTMSNRPEGYKTEAEAAAHMVTIVVPAWKMNADGSRYSSSYELTINKKLAVNTAAIFDEIYALPMKFPIRLLKGYGYRKVGGVGLSNSTLMSVHSFGAAIDINYGDYDNDYFLGYGNDLRDKSNPYCIPDEVIDIFAKYGWYWGGNFSICADTMHFQYLGLDFLTYQGNDPFRTLTVKNGTMKGEDVKNLQDRLYALGYQVPMDGVYGNRMVTVVKKFQITNGLPVTGEVDYKTWETVINKTHDMPYVF